MFPPLPNYTDRKAQERLHYLEAIAANKKRSRFTQSFQALRHRMTDRQSNA